MMCIYAIKNLTNNKLYIGMSISFRQRKHSHIKNLKANKHHSTYLQNAWNKYGCENFEFIILDTNVSTSNISAKEKYYIDLYKSLNPEYGYNMQNPSGKFEPKSKDISVKEKISNTLKSKYIPKPAYVLYFKTGELTYYNDRRGIPSDIIGNRGRNYLLGTVRLPVDFTLQDFKQAYEKYNHYLKTNTNDIQLILKSDTEEYLFTSFSQVSKFLYNSDSATKVLQQAILSNSRLQQKYTLSYTGVSTQNLLPGGYH